MKNNNAPKKEAERIGIWSTYVDLNTNTRAHTTFSFSHQNKKKKWDTIHLQLTTVITAEVIKHPQETKYKQCNWLLSHQWPYFTMCIKILWIRPSVDQLILHINHSFGMRNMWAVPNQYKWQMMLQYSVWRYHKYRDRFLLKLLPMRVSNVLSYVSLCIIISAWLPQWCHLASLNQGARMMHCKNTRL